ncbi:vitamin B12 ABC transporter substrate-binding protein BtuF [Veronia nyctiphanis]|uniref:Vitamin B12 ABC transporter substrate-binding protein BtuF n=1 Tax=Veronia nyctiphanis TaxID=1278244 RepID=A0A4Q0YWZ0_9GAMM|nr:vitamin B12 ABC transporter substrate-binding protein BtuF [Veronia nyctiphanis]RXJ73759.1 vitamin B12 ABC transporter substrate-binding protein BtuF [Veronia nyctiphanis]
MKRFLFTILLSLPVVAHAAELKVISLSPHATELAYTAGLGDAMIAVDDYSHYPAEVDKLEHVASYKGLNIERIAALQPDLVISWKGGNPADQVEKLEKLGITVFHSTLSTLDNTANELEALSKYASDSSIGEKAADEMRKELAEIRKAQEGKAQVAYFYQLSSNPLFTVSGNNWPNPLFAICGGKNTFEAASAAYPQVNKEQVIVKKPEAIFYADGSTDPKVFWESWKDHLPAAQSEAVFNLTADWVNQATPRSLKAVKQICTAMDKVREQA